MTPIEEIKSKLAVEQVIGEYVTLKQSGTNFKGLCPFHQEKSPSFMVSPEKGIWHCFGCNEGGDIFTFVQKHEGLEFKEAAQILAERAGVVLAGFKLPDHSKKQILYTLNHEAEDFYEKQLHSARTDSTKTLGYLASRGLTDATIREWKLGLAPDSWDMLAGHLRGKKYADADIVAAGLAISREQKFFDRFRKRLMFPIHDAQGKTVAFTARTLQYIVYDVEDQGGKYVNSPQTPIYNKSQILYGFDKAKHEIKRLDYAIIVEGNMDVIMSHQAGTKNVVAVSGTALTIEQLKLLSRYTRNIILSFDADTAGSQAVFRGITLAWDHDMNVKVVILSEGKDPAESIQKNPELWREAIKNSIGVVDFYFDAVFARVDLTRADHKKIAAQKIMSIINRLKTSIEQDHYVQLLASRLGVGRDILQSMVKAPAPEAVIHENLVGPVQSSAAFLSERLIIFMVELPAFTLTIINEVEPEMLAGSLQELYKKIIIHYTKGQSQNFRDLAASLGPSELQLWSKMVFQGEQAHANVPPQEQEQELALIMRRIKNVYYAEKLHELTDAIRLAEQLGDQPAVENLLREYQAVSKRRQA